LSVREQSRSRTAGVALGAIPEAVQANAWADAAFDQIVDVFLSPSQLLAHEVLRRPLEFTPLGERPPVADDPFESTGVIHQYVDLAVPGFRYRLRHRFAQGKIGDVTGDGYGRATPGLDLVGHQDRAGTVDVRDRNLGALLSEADPYGAPHTVGAAATRDDRNLVLEPLRCFDLQLHGSASLV